MKKVISLLFAMLLLGTSGAQAQKRIKAINITVEMPKPGADIIDGAAITSITTDVFGSQNMLGEGKMDQTALAFYEINTLGQPTEPQAESKFEAGKEYMLYLTVTNLTDVLFNYKNDKEYTADNTTVKATINGKTANIRRGSSGRPLLCDVKIKMPGECDPYLANTKVSAADGDQAGHGYVDLGLPSGTKWATCNVGASKPEGYGDMFAYGETKTKENFRKSNFSGYGAYIISNPLGLKSASEEDNKFVYDASKKLKKLRTEYDAARQNMGGEWSLPTIQQCKELMENTDAKLLVVNGVKGTLYTSLKNGKSIFLPYAGAFSTAQINGRGTDAQYMTANGEKSDATFVITWGSSNTFDKNSGINLFQHNTDEDHTAPATIGLPVRAVWGGKEIKESKKSGKGLKGLLNKGKGLFNKL